ncbi:MAG: nicotinate-nucleotide--dimethylbenzimidazole phosphoribosyltransferase [Caloramator sp.]|nr:nicotinate-nucleotide--dimethylbenzimidazole phosphoribosyltransferase [Caloramator sp.]
MELLKKTIDNIKPLNKTAMENAWKHIDNLTKPIGSLGILEEIGARFSGITGKLHNKVKKKNIVIMAADNGVVEEGVSCAPKFITKVVTENFTRGITGVCILAKQAGADLTIVDIGVDADFNNPKILNKKIAYGTKNITKEAAMSYEEAIRAIEVGIDVVDNLVMEGVDLLGTGEMGIGNTTTSAAVLCALSGLSPDIVVGKGAGLTDEQHKNKINVVKKALEVNKPDSHDPIDVISKVGGFDIAGLTGCFLAAAKNRVPIVIDGFISSAAALCAVRLNSLVKDYIFPSHLSAEPGAIYMMKELGLEPMLNLKMRLGEGSGCPLAFMIIESALAIVNEMGTFEEANIVNDFLIDIREK